MHFSIAVITRETDVSRIPNEVESLLMRYSQFGNPMSPDSEFDFIEDDYGDEINPDTGKRGYYVNLDMEYDYYELGGRFGLDEGFLLANAPADNCISTMVSSVDPDAWGPSGHLGLEAVVTPDGIWHPYEEADKFSDIVQTHRDCAVTVVDCHI